MIIIIDIDLLTEH